MAFVHDGFVGFSHVNASRRIELSFLRGVTTWFPKYMFDLFKEFELGVNITLISLLL